MTSPFKPYRRLKLLVSVRNAAEAEAALAGGADWIDLKEPARGALGAVDARQAREIAKVVAGRAPISAALGELLDWSNSTASELLSIDGISYFKLGLSLCRGRSWRRQWHSVREHVEPAGGKLIAVIYADGAAASSPSSDEVSRVAREARCDWILVDTYDKSSGALTDLLSCADLRALLGANLAYGLKPVVAGRLTQEAITELPLELIDMIAVRGAACEGGRAGMVCRERVAALKQLLATAPMT
jgi:(5-formylfuran-3-yl)methyl phosphate synthase